jgi:hypothetical protein
MRIVNASPLILLTKIGRIDLLDAEDVDVVVPMPVLQEVSNLDPADPAVRAIDDAGWLECRDALIAGPRISAWFKNTRFRVTLGISARTLIGPVLKRVHERPWLPCRGFRL